MIPGALQFPHSLSPHIYAFWTLHSVVPTILADLLLEVMLSGFFVRPGEDGLMWPAAVLQGARMGVPRQQQIYVWQRRLRVGCFLRRYSFALCCWNVLGQGGLYQCWSFLTSGSFVPHCWSFREHCDFRPHCLAWLGQLWHTMKPWVAIWQTALELCCCRIASSHKSSDWGGRIGS